MANDLRAVMREVSSDPVPGLDDGTAPVAPTHLTPRNPMKRALRWLTGSLTGESTASVSAKSPGRVAEAHESPMTSLGDRDRKSVAILPFKNVGNDKETDFYQFSLADAAITELARVRSLVVGPSCAIV
jgi:serine/threonine-protein kinase